MYRRKGIAKHIYYRNGFVEKINYGKYPLVNMTYI